MLAAEGTSNAEVGRQVGVGHATLGELLDRVELVRESLLSLTADGYGMDWFCFVGAAALEHAVEINQKLMSRLAMFPGSLLIDTYGALAYDD